MFRNRCSEKEYKSLNASKYRFSDDDNMIMYLLPFLLILPQFLTMTRPCKKHQSVPTSSSTSMRFIRSSYVVTLHFHKVSNIVVVNTNHDLRCVLPLYLPTPHSKHQNICFVFFRGDEKPRPKLLQKLFFGQPWRFQNSFQFLFWRVFFFLHR